MNLVFCRFQRDRQTDMFLDALASLKTMFKIQYYRVLQSITEYYRVMQSITEYYRVFHIITEYHRVLQSIT